MADIKTTTSILKMEDFYFSYFEFSRNDTSERNDVPEIGLGKENQYNDGILTETVFFQASSKEYFDLKLTAVGKFKCDSEKISVDHFEKNALSIMFPYIRSEITLLTSQPNFKPIILPPINVNALFEKLQEESCKQENNE